MFAIPRSFFPMSTHLCRLYSARPERRPLPFDLSLYLIANRTKMDTDDDFVARVTRAVQGGVTCVQLRDPSGDIDACIRTAKRVKEVTRRQGIPLLINEHPEVARRVGAEGVHLKRNQMPIQEARRLLGPHAIIGYTVETVEEVAFLETSTEVDYISVHLFPSKITKPVSDQIWGLEGLKEIRALLPHRIVAIGGIDRSNVEKVFSYLHPGKERDGIAMAGALWRGDLHGNNDVVAKEISHAIQKIIAKSSSL